MPGRALYTIGHSTRSTAQLLELLREAGITTLVDVRTIPRSRHNPQFDQAALEAALARAGLEYRHVKALGGLRRPRKDSVNLGWRNASFRGYADHVQTEEFARALAELEALALPPRPHRGRADRQGLAGAPPRHRSARRAAGPPRADALPADGGGAAGLPAPGLTYRPSRAGPRSRGPPFRCGAGRSRTAGRESGPRGAARSTRPGPG
jgi:uncharacterized protein DUF488